VSVAASVAACPAPSETVGNACQTRDLKSGTMHTGVADITEIRGKSGSNQGKSLCAHKIQEHANAGGIVGGSEFQLCMGQVQQSNSLSCLCVHDWA
jgi:hypothetical protein